MLIIIDIFIFFLGVVAGVVLTALASIGNHRISEEEKGEKL